MPAVTSSSNLVELIQKLESQQRVHAENAAALGETLSHIGSLLGSLIGGQRVSAAAAAPKAAVVAKAPTQKPAKSPASKPAKPATASKGTQNRFAVTGDESVLGFIRKRGNPTTSEVQAHWTGEGRGASADNSLSKLFKEKKIKREPNKQGRGSRYTIA